MRADDDQVAAALAGRIGDAVGRVDVRPHRAMRNDAGLARLAGGCGQDAARRPVDFLAVLLG